MSSVRSGNPERSGLNKEKDQLGYEGPAELVWGSWVIEGQAHVRERASQAVPVGPQEGISTGPSDASGEGFVGAFTAASGTEPTLLASLASALGEGYTLRWQRGNRNERMTITVTAKHGNRIHFETRE